MTAAPPRDAVPGAGRVSWLVLRDNTCVVLSASEDLLSDAVALIEDLDTLMQQSARLTADARLLVARSREGRR